MLILPKKHRIITSLVKGNECKVIILTGNCHFITVVFCYKYYTITINKKKIHAKMENTTVFQCLSIVLIEGYDKKYSIIKTKAHIKQVN